MKKRLLLVGAPAVGAVLLSQVMATGSLAAIQPVNPAGTDKVTSEGAYPSGVTWNTPFIIQNLGSSTATVVVDFYNIATQAKVHTFAAGTIAAGASLPVRPAQIDGLAQNQKYSVVISSDQPVGAVVNEQATQRLMSYIGATSGGSTVYLPNITKTYVGYNTVIYIQNVGSVDLTDVKVTFTPFAAGGSSIEKTYSIKAGASQEIDPTTVTELADGTQYSARVSSATAGASLTAVANQLGASAGTESAYSGFIAGATKLYSPNIVKQYAGFNSPVVIQNVGSSNVNVTVRYFYGEQAASGLSFASQGLQGKEAESYTTSPTGEVITLTPGQSYAERAHSRPDTDLPGGQYSMVIEAAGPVVAIVNQANATNNTQAGSYDAFVSGAKKVSLPNIVRDYASTQSPIVVQNIGASATKVTVKYYYGERAQAGPTFAEQGLQGQLAATVEQTIAAGANAPFRIHNVDALAGKDGQYSAIVESDTSDIVAIVNQATVVSLGGSGLDLGTYEGINQ